MVSRCDGAPVQIAVIVPAYNESHLLPGTLAELSAFLRDTGWDWSVVVVDDGSTDDTAAVVADAASREPRIRLQREPHRGKGGAVTAGFLRTRAAYLFLCDADLSMPIRELPRFVDAARAGADIVVGSREGQGARRVGEPWTRHLAGRVFNLAVRWIVLGGIDDTQCGFKLFTSDAAAAVFPEVHVDGWAFDVEVLAEARSRGLRILEIPIEWHYRATSKIAVTRDTWPMFRDLVRIRARRRARPRR